MAESPRNRSEANNSLASRMSGFGRGGKRSLTAEKNGSPAETLSTQGLNRTEFEQKVEARLAPGLHGQWDGLKKHLPGILKATDEKTLRNYLTNLDDKAGMQGQMERAVRDVWKEMRASKKTESTPPVAEPKNPSEKEPSEESAKTDAILDQVREATSGDAHKQIDAFATSRKLDTEKTKELSSIMKRIYDGENGARAELKKSFGADRAFDAVSFIDQIRQRLIMDLLKQVSALEDQNKDLAERVSKLEELFNTRNQQQGNMPNIPQGGMANMPPGQVGQVNNFYGSPHIGGGMPQGAPQQWQRPIGPAGYESPYGMAQPGYRWVQEPIPGYVPPQPQQAPAPEAPRAEAPRAEKAPDVIHMPPDPTLKTGEEAPKSPAQQAAEEMKKSVEGKLPSSIESVLMQKRGETPMWKRVRNTVGLMLAGGIAGATLVATAGVPVFLSGMLAGSQLAAFAPILTGVGSGAIAGLASGATRGALDARSAIGYLKEKDSNKYISWNEIFTHVFRKSLVGAKFGAIGGGIGAGVMDAYGDQIRVGAEALGDWANKEATDGLFGSGAVTDMTATPVLPGCTSADAMNALRVDIDGIKAALSTIISNQTVDAEGIKTIAEAVKSGVSLSDLQSALAGVQTNIESSISALSLEQQAYFRELFNNYGNTAYYFFQQDIVMPDVPADVVPAEPSLPDAPDDVSESPDASGVEDISAIDQAVMDAFTQPVTNGGVWTASERVWSAVGITPESGQVGSLDLLTYLTDLAEDYTQDGSVTGTRETSYFRNLGEGLLARMTGQEGVTQATIRNPINMAELFGNEKIQQDILRRISENPALSAQTRSLIEVSAEKIFTLANTALSK